MTDLESIVVHYPQITGVHDACLAIPEIEPDDFATLVASIRDRGLMEPIALTPDGKLLDGRNRIRACYEAHVEIRTKVVSTDPWMYAWDQNVSRRHLEKCQRAMVAHQFRPHFDAMAKERQREHGGTAPGKKSLPEILPELNRHANESRNQAAKLAGVSGKTMDKAKKVHENAPDLVPKVMRKEITLEQASREATKRESAAKAHAVPKPEAVKVDPEETALIVTLGGKEKRIPKPKSVRFNQTTDDVDWARWTWNPVTGCEHGCNFCYAREIAHNDRMKDVYPFKFEPTYHEYRLDAPKNTPKPQSNDPRDGRVFVCSMADLFGKWVPDAWIESVFDACLGSPEWEYLFLTKWPARYAKLPLIERAWYGASIVKQSDVDRVAKGLSAIDAPNITRWVSMEPMLEPIRFDDLTWCDLMVIGSQTSTTQPNGFVPEFAPEFDWIFDVVDQCRVAGVPYYLKANLGLKSPGMKLPKMRPRNRVSRRKDS